MSERTIVTLPYRGLRCRELDCQAEIVMATTTRHRQMPLEREPTFLGALIEAKPEGEELDERGLFVAVRGRPELRATRRDAGLPGPLGRLRGRSALPPIAPLGSSAV
jgi:hypothetical protein